MDRYDPPEPPSIFSQPEVEFDGASAWSPSETTPSPQGPPYRDSPPRGGGDPSRRLLVAVGAGGILLIGLIGYVGASVLRTIDDPALAAGSPMDTASPKPSPTPSDSPTPTPSPSPSVGPTPTLRPQPATPLLAGRWATVLADVVQLRGAPGQGSSVVGAAGRGEIVFIRATDAPVDADGLTWYPAVADPNELGWVAGHGETEQLLRSDAPSAEITWCGSLSAPVYSFMTQGLEDEAVVAGLPVATSALGREASSALELLWGAQISTCLALTVDAGTTSAATIQVQESFCAHPVLGPTIREIAFPEVGQSPPDAERFAMVDTPVLGVEQGDGIEANIEDVWSVAMGEGRDTLAVCFDLIANGGGDDTTIETTVTTAACVVIDEISASTVTMSDPAGRWIEAVELDRTPGSVVAPNLETGVATGVRLSARMGPQGVFSLQPADLEGC